MRYTKAVTISSAAELRGLHAGQWIIMDGTRGRFMGFTANSVYVAWGTTATKRFKKFAAVFKANAATKH